MATSTLHSVYCTLLFYLSQNVGPFPVVSLSYASTNILTGAWHGWQIINHYLPRIRPEADPVEEACEYIKHPLQPLHLGLGDESIVGIKVLRQVPYL